MCGIIGGLVKGEIAPTLYEGLRRLEYRGYDSAGILTATAGFHLAKRRGRVEQLQPLLADLKGRMGMGHTRWATHGEPTDQNAHPHIVGEWAVVHNGMIENYLPLKTELEAKGHTFCSQTDSEVIAHLLSEEEGESAGRILRVVARLRGTYALVIMHRGEEVLYAYRCKNPLLLGKGEGCWVSSDVTALSGIAPQLYPMEEGELAVIGEQITLYRRGEVQPIVWQKNCVEVNDWQLGDSPHYMWKEMQESVPTILHAVRQNFARARELVCRAQEICFVGCGTAYHAALYGSTLTQKPNRVVTAGELRYEGKRLSPDCLVIAISQSGETADTLECASRCKSWGCKVLAVTNVPFSALTRIADVTLLVGAGCEVCVASTKSYVGQVVVLDRLFGGSMAEINRLRRGIATVLSQSEKAKQIAALVKDCRYVCFLGRGIDYAVARESSLKLKEVSYIPCEALPAGELKHGTLALMDERTLCIFLNSQPRHCGRVASGKQQVLSRRGKVVEMGCSGDWKLPSGKHSPLVMAVATQMIAYYTAVALGRDPDKPRNLAKSVTVE